MILERIASYKIPFAMKVYNRAGTFASMFLFTLQIILASETNWVILIDYNAYGEGFIELVMMILLLLTLIFECIVSLTKYLKELDYDIRNNTTEENESTESRTHEL
jgi:hypothetical protein